MNRRSFFKAIPLAALSVKASALQGQVDSILLSPLTFKPEAFSMLDHSENWKRAEPPESAWDFPGYVAVSKFTNDALCGVPVLIESVFGVVGSVQLPEQYISESGKDWGFVDNSRLNKLWARALKHIPADPEYESYKKYSGWWNKRPPSGATLCCTAQRILLCFPLVRESIEDQIEFYRLRQPI
jgi:hypothetical protein